MRTATLAAALAIPNSRAAMHIDAVNEGIERFGINTTTRRAMWLGNVGVESGGLRYLAELWGPTVAQRGYAGRADLGNTRPEAVSIARKAGVDVGRFFAGVGVIQITGYDNILAASLALFGDDRAAQNPQLLAEPRMAAVSGAWWWSAHGCNELADPGDDTAFVRTAGRVNRGTPNAAPATIMHLSERRAYWASAAIALARER